MHKRTFSRVGPRRAKMLFYALAFVAVYLSWRVSTCRWSKAPCTPKRRSRNAATHRGLRAARQHSGSRWKRAGAFASLGKRLRYSANLADPDANDRAAGSVVGKIGPSTAALLHDKHLQFVWIARKIAPDVAAKVQAMDINGIAVIEEDTGRRIDVWEKALPPCWASSASTKTVFPGWNTRTTICSRARRAA